MHDRRLSIAIPASLVSDVPHLREKTFKIGLIGRATAIFNVDEIIVFPDFPGKNQRRDIKLITRVLSYMETPQYLRKQLFKIEPELRYAGILPPLRTPHHPLHDRMKDLRIGEHREGVVVSSSEEGSLVNIGVEQPALISNLQLRVNKRVTVKITSVEEHPKAVLASRDEIKVYWGYSVVVSDVPFGKMVKKGSFDLVVATSKHGALFTQIRDKLMKQWKKSRRILVAFGAPTQGLHEIAAREQVRLKEIVHFTTNTIPNQGTETVRTVEAVYASLALLNLLKVQGNTKR
ncbi:MAG: RNA methyltransferase [Thermoproteota archaeon]|nr:RNA methyltransferase [Thermoproteota archaeon]